LKIKNKKIKKKIGVLGGTFDPPHKGHLYISKTALKKLRLNKIIWVITKKNPLKKKPWLKTKIRIRLSEEITKRERKIFIQYLDNKIKSSNTYNLLKYLKKNNNGASLYFLMGADNLSKFHKWNNWKKIPKIAKIVVFKRKKYSSKSLNSVVSKNIDKNDWIYIKSKEINISSTLIRKFW
jgi:nicotinate-nucleotide adenylyltransferase